MIIQSYILVTSAASARAATQTFEGTGNSLASFSAQNQAFEQPQGLSAVLMALCTEDEAGFLANKKKLEMFACEMVCFESARLLAKNGRSCRLLSMLSHPAFFSDWHNEDAKTQTALFGGLALHSLNKNTKEAAFHHVAKALRKDVLCNQSVNKPTKLRLRDCNSLIVQFMYEYARLSDVNCSIVLAALADCKQSGCGHLPWQQAAALAKKLERSS